ncbi:hypothetical protein NY537_03070 [Curtobacterium flaccumfaciens pv. betae]|uniref:hypothetical protein n=1 Tax=Curtobacterium flaccumfaciens TaxID=2035 RepID=UPI00265A429E|nr:hypothetical protein [Curtobacterium flaccumfaciens]MCS5511725.1 hypothetical protein [Curtobacterium flaccumfaciens pv. betae]
MNDEHVRYETKTVHAIRGREGKARSKMEQDGWELVQQNPGALRSSLVFRRPKKPLPKKALIIGGSVAAVAVVGIIIGAITEGDPAPVETATAIARPEASASATTSAVPTPSATAFTGAAAASASANVRAVTDAEVLQVFDDYFAERSSKGVVLAKAVSQVRFEGGIVKVTFDPAKAGITRDQFDYINPFPNLASFVASPIAFNDDVGNRIRPSVQSIATVASDGAPLGSFTHDQILALNELER